MGVIPWQRYAERPHNAITMLAADILDVERYDGEVRSRADTGEELSEKCVRPGHGDDVEGLNSIRQCSAGKRSRMGVRQRVPHRSHSRRGRERAMRKRQRRLIDSR